MRPRVDGYVQKDGGLRSVRINSEEILKRGLNVDDGSLEEEVERMRYAYHIFQNAEEDEREKRYADAVERYTQLLEMDCGERCEIARARMFTFARENLTQILKFTLDAIRRDDSRVDMHALRGRALCLTADGDFENGIKFFKHALTQNPDDTKTMRLFKDAKKIKVRWKMRERPIKTESLPKRSKCSPRLSSPRSLFQKRVPYALEYSWKEPIRIYD